MKRDTVAPERQARQGTIAYDTSAVSDGAAVFNSGWWLPEAALNRLGVEQAVKTAGKRAGGVIDVGPARPW